MTVKELIEELESHPEFMAKPVVFANYFPHTIDDIAWKEIPNVDWHYAKTTPDGEYNPDCVELYFGENA